MVKLGHVAGRGKNAHRQQQRKQRHPRGSHRIGSCPHSNHQTRPRRPRFPSQRPRSPLPPLG
jgi:hypothetical protein